MEFSTLVQFAKLVSDSPTSEGVFSLLAKTVVEAGRAFHAIVFGTAGNGDFRLLSGYGGCGHDAEKLDLEGIDSIADLQKAIAMACENRGYGVRTIPLISEAGLFGALAVLYYSDSNPVTPRHWTLIEGLTELTAISLNKTYQHQKLQKAFDDLRISQDALVRTEKFRALGQMSAGIAHDLRNLLNPLLLYTDQIRDDAGNRHEVLEIAARVERILTRGLETVERLRDFSRQSSETSEALPTDLNVMVREAMEISRSRLNGIEIALRLGASPMAPIRPADCITAIVNLLLNSADALEGKGKISLATGASDGGAWIEIADNGPGIAPEIKGRILEPFFTTKGNTGTGLGLSIVYAFTQRHGGRLEIESHPGRGARFKMWFPATMTTEYAPHRSQRTE